GELSQDHLSHVANVVREQGSRCKFLGPVSNRIYTQLKKGRVFNEFNAMVPSKGAAEEMPDLLKQHLRHRHRATRLHHSQCSQLLHPTPGEWAHGKFHGFGKLVHANGSSYEGMWKDGLRHGPGKLTYKSGTVYEGDFLRGHRHGRGRFSSVNLSVTYDGHWDHSFVSGMGTLTMPNGEVHVRDWPKRGKLGGGLSVRGCMELVEEDEELRHLDKLQEREELYGVATMVELNHYISTVRQEMQEARARDKAELRQERIRNRRAGREALLAAAHADEDAEEEDDFID
ncbi:unnamed protein product, partial [Chrysoparadoxa australica]